MGRNMSDWVPVALACGHVLQDQAMYEQPAVGSGEPARVECPHGCGMVEYVLPPDLQNRPEGPYVEIDLGWLDEGDNVDIHYE